MQRTGGGVMVNAASVAALSGTPDIPAYVANKAAVLGLTMPAAKDRAPYGIRANVAPRVEAARLATAEVTVIPVDLEGKLALSEASLDARRRSWLSPW